MKIIITSKKLESDIFKAKTTYTVDNAEVKAKLASKKSFSIGDNIYIFEAIYDGERYYSENVNQFIELLEKEILRSENEKWYLILHGRDVNQKASFLYENKLPDTEVILYDSSSGYLLNLFNQKASDPKKAEEIIETFFLFQRYFYYDFTQWEGKIRDNQDSENITGLIKEFRAFVFARAGEIKNENLLKLFRNALDQEECKKNGKILADTIYDLREIDLYGYEL